MLQNLQELGVIKNKRGHGGTKNSTDTKSYFQTCSVDCTVDKQLCVLLDTLNAIKCFANYLKLFKTKTNGTRKEICPHD